MTRGSFHALLDADDRVLSGDARFAELNDRAGGQVGGGLALAAVAALVRIARGLRVPVARMIVIGDEDSDGDWHVRAVPGEDATVALAATLLRERPGAMLAPGTIAAAEPPADAAWSWEVDAGLRVVRIDTAAIARHGIGQLKRDELARSKAGLEMSLMHGIKALFDPSGILNPGKLLQADVIRVDQG